MSQFDHGPDRLPPPSGDAAVHSAALAAHIREQIAAAAGGAVSFERFMELALYAPGLGYYSAGARKFGEAGDFVTAPEISPLFSRCVARQAAQVLAGVGGDVLEVGAGSGAMAADVLAELQALGQLPDTYFILEVSADLRQRQRQHIAARLPRLLERVHWLDGLPEAGFRGVVLANEVLDAMPVRRFKIQEEGVAEWFVAAEGERFQWALRPAAVDLAQRVRTIQAAAGEGALAAGYSSEVNFAAERWIASVGAMLERGAVFIIDYGFPAREYYHPQRSDGTLMCHYRHRNHPDPLILVGLQDITAHVDVSAVAQSALAAGLQVAGYTTQAYFLLASGLDRMIAESDPDQMRSHLELAQQVKKLTMPEQMGELFKVLALTRAWDEPLQGFGFMDHRGRL